MKVSQDRLGHADPKTTMLYTQAVSEDERRTAQQLGVALEEGFQSGQNDRSFLHIPVALPFTPLSTLFTFFYQVRTDLDATNIR